MNPHISAIRELCESRNENLPPFIVRTRFERELYGLLVSLSRRTYGDQPSSMDRTQVMTFLSRQQNANELVESRVMLEISRIFEKFVYVCDTSNWSNDGQDPRVKACSAEILAVCKQVEMIDNRTS